jgi:ribosomal protein L32
MFDRLSVPGNVCLPRYGAPSVKSLETAFKEAERIGIQARGFDLNVCAECGDQDITGSVCIACKRKFSRGWRL